MTLLLSLLSLSLAPALAETPAASAPPASEVAAPSLDVSADLRDEYLAGERILVTIGVRNLGASPTDFPDLASRPWLVRFLFNQDKGQSQARYTTPPSSDPGGTWSLAPRGQRRTTLLIPSGAAMRPGTYALTIEVQGDSGAPRQIGPNQIRIAPPRPVTGDLAPDRAATGRTLPSAVWAHKAAGGYDLYLHQAESADLRRVVGNAWLTRTKDAPDPRLTAARASDLSDRYVVWAEGDRGISYVRLQGDEIRGEVRRLEVPWPAMSVLGRGATDAEGGLHVPVWVPAPKGEGGELRVASIDERGRPTFRRAARMTTRPTRAEAIVDAAGGVQFLVQTAAGLEIYTLKTHDSEELPLAGRRLWAAQGDARLLGFEVGTLPGDESRQGGIALLIASASGGALKLGWRDLRGRELLSLPSAKWEPGDALLGLSPRGSDPAGLLVRAADGAVSYREGDATAALSSLAPHYGLLRDAEGRPVLRELIPDVGVRVTLLEPVAPTADGP